MAKASAENKAIGREEIGRELTRAHDENRVLKRLFDVAYSSLDIDSVLFAAVDLVLEATHADACFLHRLDEANNRLVLRAASEPYRSACGKVTLHLGEGVAGWVAQHREPVVIAEDKWSDPRYKYIPELGGKRYTSMLSIPLISRDRLIGVVNLHTEKRRDYVPADISFLTQVASILAAAIEHAELFRTLADKEAALQQIVATTIQAQEEERRRIAMEIHDGVTQQLISIWYRVLACENRIERDEQGALEELAEAKELISEALAEARTAVYDLRPATLDDLGLMPSIEGLLARTFGYGPGENQVQADVYASVDMDIPKHLELALYRIAQEALSNTRKHADATRVAIELRCDTTGIRMTIHDDGRGFDFEAYRRDRPEMSFGLLGMDERVMLVGGSLTVETAPGQGTLIEVRIPASSIAAPSVGQEQA